MPKGTETIKFELREKNAINAEIQKQLQDDGINAQQAEIITALKGIKDKMNPQFTRELSDLKGLNTQKSILRIAQQIGLTLLG